MTSKKGLMTEMTDDSVTSKDSTGYDKVEEIMMENMTS